MRAIDIPLPGPGDGLRVGRAQHLRLIDEVRDLTPEQWDTVTECPAWTVRDMVGHVASAARFPGNPLLFIVDAQIGRFRYRGRSSLDAANEVGIDRHRSLSTAELLELLRRRTMSGRDTPGWMRRRLTNDAALPSYTTIGSFVDTILTRDTWLHRHDIGRAVGREPVSDPSDAEVVEQVIRDLGPRGPALRPPAPHRPRRGSVGPGGGGGGGARRRGARGGVHAAPLRTDGGGQPVRRRRRRPPSVPRAPGSSSDAHLPVHDRRRPSPRRDHGHRGGTATACRARLGPPSGSGPRGRRRGRGGGGAAEDEGRSALRNCPLPRHGGGYSLTP